MKILAFVGSRTVEQGRIIRAMAKDIAPEYRVLKIKLDQPGFIEGRRMAHLRKRCAEGIPPDTVLTVCGVNSVDEYRLLKRHKAFFCLLPGALPRLITRHDIPIDDSFVFVAQNPETLETASKRRQFCDPVSAFSRCLVAELERQKVSKEAIYVTR